MGNRPKSRKGESYRERERAEKKAMNLKAKIERVIIWKSEMK